MVRAVMVMSLSRWWVGARCEPDWPLVLGGVSGRAFRRRFADAEHYGVANGDMMQLKVVSNDCSVTFEDVLVRADEAAKLEVHIDTDEGNACNLDAATEITLQKSGCRCSG